VVNRTIKIFNRN